jgi:FliA/WhiG family RNA polymerase sigma factor
MSAGMLGLLDAYDKFDAKKGTKFETYAVWRIKGAVLDQLRALDWASRSIRRKAREVDASMRRLDQRLGRAASEEEIAKEAKMPLGDYHRLMDQVRGAVLLSLDEVRTPEDGDSIGLADMIEDPSTPDVLARIEEEETRALLLETLNQLPEQERVVVALYYYEHMTLREIGLTLGISGVAGLAGPFARGRAAEEPRAPRPGGVMSTTPLPNPRAGRDCRAPASDAELEAIAALLRTRVGDAGAAELADARRAGGLRLSRRPISLKRRLPVEPLGQPRHQQRARRRRRQRAAARARPGRRRCRRQGAPRGDRPRVEPHQAGDAQAVRAQAGAAGRRPRARGPRREPRRAVRPEAPARPAPPGRARRGAPAPSSCSRTRSAGRRPSSRRAAPRSRPRMRPERRPTSRARSTRSFWPGPAPRSSASPSRSSPRAWARSPSWRRSRATPRRPTWR